MNANLNDATGDVETVTVIASVEATVDSATVAAFRRVIFAVPAATPVRVQKCADSEATYAQADPNVLTTAVSLE